MMVFYVYKIIDPRNDELYYIGKGRDSRMRAHLRPYNLRKNTPTNKRHKEILSRGLEPVFVKIKRNISETEAFNLERKLIDSVGLENLTNIYPGGGGCSGLSLSEEHKEKISKAVKDYIEENGHNWEGKKHSKKTKKKMSKSALGRKHSKETRKKISETKKGKNNPNFGKPRSKEVRKKISESNKGKVGSWTGGKHSEETKEKMSEARKKYWRNKRRLNT